MIAYLGATRDLSPAEAYGLCSVAVDLKISEVVDAPNWVVLGLPARRPVQRLTSGSC